MRLPLPPFTTNHFTISGELTEVATCNGVRPCLSPWFKSAPFVKKYAANSVGQ